MSLGLRLLAGLWCGLWCGAGTSPSWSTAQATCGVTAHMRLVGCSVSVSTVRCGVDPLAIWTTHLHATHPWVPQHSMLWHNGDCLHMIHNADSNCIVCTRYHNGNCLHMHAVISRAQTPPSRLQVTFQPTAGGCLWLLPAKAGTTLTTPSHSVHATASNGGSLTPRTSSSGPCRPWDWFGTCSFQQRSKKRQSGLTRHLAAPSAATASSSHRPRQ